MQWNKMKKKWKEVRMNMLTNDKYNDENEINTETETGGSPLKIKGNFVEFFFVNIILYGHLRTISGCTVLQRDSLDLSGVCPESINEYFHN